MGLRAWLSGLFGCNRAERRLLERLKDIMGQKTVDEIIAELKDAEAKKEALKQENAAQAAQIAQLTTDAKTKDDQIAAQATAITDANQQIKTLTDQLSSGTALTPDQLAQLSSISDALDDAPSAAPVDPTAAPAAPTAPTGTDPIAAG